MPPSLQMRKQSLVPGKSYAASHRAEQGLNIGWGWEEGRGWRWSHSIQVRSLVQVWHVRAVTMLGAVRIRKTNFDKWHLRWQRLQDCLSNSVLNEDQGGTRISNSLCGLAQEPDPRYGPFVWKAVFWDTTATTLGTSGIINCAFSGAHKCHFQTVCSYIWFSVWSWSANSSPTIWPFGYCPRGLGLSASWSALPTAISLVLSSSWHVNTLKNKLLTHLEATARPFHVFSDH